ncbi:MAG: MauE/DoxX family redox-associated membrane protein [Labedaea sp.]
MVSGSTPVTGEFAGALAVILAAVLGWAGAAKMRTAAEFDASLAVLLPAGLRRPARVVVPMVEIGLAGWLVSGVAARPAGLAATVLLGTFLVAQAVLRRAGYSGCGCFGGPDTMPGQLAWVRTAGLLVAALAIAAFAADRSGWWLSSPATLLAQATVALGVVLCWHCGLALATWRRVR